MHIPQLGVLVTGGSSGLGRATAERLAAQGALVTIADLPKSDGAAVADAIGPSARFVPADITNTEQVRSAVEAAGERTPLRAVVHCAGRGGPLRIIEKDGSPGSIDHFRAVLETNLVGSFNVLRLAAVHMGQQEPIDGERGVIVLTSSVAAFEGQIGQLPYSASKAGVHGMTLVAARDLASKLIRVCTIAPGLFDTPMLAGLPDAVRDSLGKSVPNPSRLGDPAEYAALAQHIVENAMLNGETIRLDGAIRMAPR